MTPEQRASDIGYCTCANIAGEHGEFCIFTRIAAAIRAAINDKLEEVAVKLDKLSQGTAQTPAGVVRAMKEHT